MAYNTARPDSRPRKIPASPRDVVSRLFIIQQNNDFDLKMLDSILQSLLIPKQLFIEKIRDDVILTAKFLKYFPGIEGFINYSEITLLAHTLIYSLEFENVPVVNDYRNKIQAHDIWKMKGIRENRNAEILEKLRGRISESEVREVQEELIDWYNGLEKQFN